MIPKITTNMEYISISMIIGGTLGNLFDRVYHNYVIDFISLNIFGYNFPVFNFADILITCGAIILIIILIRSDKSANNRGQK
jgi:signal peptidase II